MTKRQKPKKGNQTLLGKCLFMNVQDTYFRSSSPNKKVETESENISLRENTESPIKPESPKQIEFSKQTEASKQIESNSNINAETVDDNHTNIESIFLKEEVVETSQEDANESNTNVTITKVKKDDKDSSCSKISGDQNANNINNKGNLPEICILCATTNTSRKNYTLIIHFSEMIMDLSGVDVSYLQ